MLLSAAWPGSRANGAGETMAGFPGRLNVAAYLTADQAAAQYRVLVDVLLDAQDERDGTEQALATVTEFAQRRWRPWADAVIRAAADPVANVASKLTQITREEKSASKAVGRISAEVTRLEARIRAQEEEQSTAAARREALQQSQAYQDAASAAANTQQLAERADQAAEIARRSGQRADEAQAATELPVLAGIAADAMDAGFRRLEPAVTDGRLRLSEAYALGVAALADALVLSCEVGAAKPAEAIFHRALDQLDVAADGAVFVDDNVDFCARATDLGMSAVQMALRLASTLPGCGKLAVAYAGNRYLGVREMLVVVPTEEQQAACEMFAGGGDLALVAGAGTTATLVLMAATTRRRGMYLAYNRAIANDARRRFGPNVTCSTAHSVAYRATGKQYRERLNTSARIPGPQAARLLGITRDLGIGSATITCAHQARLVMGMIRRFCYSNDDEVTARHMGPVNGLDVRGQDYLAGVLRPYAVRAWEDICDPRGRLRFEHDHYLKMWALTRPVLIADFVLLDEAQDTNPVLEEIFLSQHAQRVCVGDPAQQIYAWRYARDVMTGFPAAQLCLTQSFRFGPRIAAVANRWLALASSSMRLTGSAGVASRVGRVRFADAVLCRGNADAMSEVLGFLASGVPVALTGGGEALRSLATAAAELQSGSRTSHPELFLFQSWGQVQEYAEQDAAGQDLRAMVRLVDTHGPAVIIDAVKRLSAEGHARVTVSTAHKAKGLEWGSVRIGPGFEPPPVDSTGERRALAEEEARLIYVAVTRAKLHLDTAGISWVDSYAAALSAGASPARLAGLPLTGQLRHPSSPVSRFLAAHLGDSGRVARDYLSRLRGLPPPAQPLDVQRPAWTALGHAIDLRLRVSLGGDLGAAVAAGVRAVGSGASGASGASDALRVAGEELLARVLGGSGRSDDELTRLCFVAGYYEDVFRTGEIRRGSLLHRATDGTVLDDLLRAVPRYAIEDIGAQLALAASPFASFRALPTSRRVCGPVFAGSADLGGADADFILDGLLLDCKATIMPARLGRDEINQLAGYLLLDYADAFGIRGVGLYLSRQGAVIDWRVDEFLGLLGARLPLAELRARLQRHLRGGAS